MIKHTQTPWITDVGEIQDEYAIYQENNDDDTDFIGCFVGNHKKGPQQAKANIDHMIKCVNAWDNLTRLKARVKVLERKGK